MPLRVLLCLPMGLLAVLVGLFVRVVWGAPSYLAQGVWIVPFAVDSWPMRTWYRSWGATTLGHVILMRAGTTREEADHYLAHESVHVEQCERAGLLGLCLCGILMLAGAPWGVGVIVWAVLPAMSYFCGALLAVLRGETAYRGNTDEESAYAQDAQHEREREL